MHLLLFASLVIVYSTWLLQYLCYFPLISVWPLATEIVSLVGLKRSARMLVRVGTVLWYKTRNNEKPIAVRVRSQ